MTNSKAYYNRWNSIRLRLERKPWQGYLCELERLDKKDSLTAEEKSLIRDKILQYATRVRQAQLKYYDDRTQDDLNMLYDLNVIDSFVYKKLSER